MKRVQVITIGGNSYVMPEHMDIKTRTQMAAALLQLQLLDMTFKPLITAPLKCK